MHITIFSIIITVNIITCFLFFQTNPPSPWPPKNPHPPSPCCVPRTRAASGRAARAYAAMGLWVDV